MKGLKQLAEEAARDWLDEVAPQMAAAAGPPPVEVSDEARMALATKMREWSGWGDSTIKFGVPEVSPYAQCDHVKRVFTANLDVLILNPHRVLLTVTPFRLKQEAVLTGCLLHESGHARHTLWKPRTDEALAEFVHGSGSTHEGEHVNKQTFALANLMEEPRVEGLMARHSNDVGASGLSWTMRAAGAHLAPFTGLSTDPGQRVMDVITSWALRSGKQIAFAHWTPEYILPYWVGDLTQLVHTVLVTHLTEFDTNPDRTAQKIMEQLILMATCVDDRGTYMVDSARDILDMLFPETDGDDEDAPQVGEGCTAQPAEGGDKAEGNEQGEGAEGDTEPEDEGEGSDPGEGSAGSEGDESGKGESGEPEVSDESDTGEGEPDEGESSEPEEEPAQEGDPGGQPEVEVDSDSELAKALRALEGRAKDETEDETEDLQTGGTTGGEGGEGSLEGGYRHATKDEREIQHSAEKFLRSMIAPSESAKVLLTDQPAATVDGAALAAWRAGGEVRAPQFFRRTNRTIEPSPPVRIAVLVDVSGSMDELQEPSAVLSWSLASAALDLRNFAGRGQQIESCLIHWGSSARVIQATNQQMPGIKTYQCVEGTSAFAQAMALVEEQLPGFFDVTEKPVNRLLVNFTDWELGMYTLQESTRWISKSMESGVNMLSVVPHGYRTKWSRLGDMLGAAKVQRGYASLVKYDPKNPGRVWETAADMLDGKPSAPFSGF